jgi:hypothetical protein
MLAGKVKEWRCWRRNSGWKRGLDSTAMNQETIKGQRVHRVFIAKLGGCASGNEKKRLKAEG